MKIAFVSTYDALDVSSWSGIPFHMSRALEAKHDVVRICPLRDRIGLLHRIDMRAREALGMPATLGGRSVVSARMLSRQARQRLPRDADVVLATATLPAAYLKTDLPVVVWSDATFAALAGFYPAFCRLSRRTRRQGHVLERRALDRCALAIFASEWAARSALRDYGCPPAKVRVVPFGANLDSPPTRDDMERAASGRSAATCRLLFVGTEWRRKRGELAVAATGLLRKGGVDARLTLVGSSPSDGALPEYVEFVGRLDKGLPEEAALLEDLYRRSHFLLLPTGQECFGIVFCEAAAFGVPVVAADVGGVSTPVRDGVNGFLLAPDAGPGEYAEVVARSFRDRDDYVRLVGASRAEYEQRLNWEAAATAVGELLAGVVSRA